MIRAHVHYIYIFNPRAILFFKYGRYKVNHPCFTPCQSKCTVWKTNEMDWFQCTCFGKEHSLLILFHAFCHTNSKSLLKQKLVSGIVNCGKKKGKQKKGTSFPSNGKFREKTGVMEMQHCKRREREQKGGSPSIIWQ